MCVIRVEHLRKSFLLDKTAIHAVDDVSFSVDGRRGIRSNRFVGSGKIDARPLSQLVGASRLGGRFGSTD